MPDPIYLDYNATTPVADEVADAVSGALRDAWGNPSSGHPYGVRAQERIERARADVARLIGCEPREIVFTSGGTESDNAAIVGVAEARADRGRHLVTSAIEHPAVEEACRYLERRGWSVTRVAVDADGTVDSEEVARSIRSDTVLVSIMHANNETGVVQPLSSISRTTRARGIPFHTDAAQSAGKVRVDAANLGVDLLTLAGHKLYAPKGVGALYVRAGTPLQPFLRGAGHEGGRRAGTENTAGIVGLGAACALALSELDTRMAWLARTRDALERGLRERHPDLIVHGAGAERLPNTLSVAIPGILANDLLSRLPEIAASAGAACHSGLAEPSRVLRAMGVADAVALGTLRLTTGRATTLEEAGRAAELIGRRAADARRA